MVRLRQLEEEAAAIRRMFPGLKKSEPTAEEAPATAPKPRPRRKRTMSAEAREAARERMKAYWAKRKGLTAEDTSPADASERPAKKRGRKKKRAGKR
jgi:hypothetical protein